MSEAILKQFLRIGKRSCRAERQGELAIAYLTFGVIPRDEMREELRVLRASVCDDWDVFFEISVWTSC
jgi:hypothetical protein